jgi:hypothetical protein
MALLTEKQINQLLKMASVTSTATSYHDELCEWNEKQAAPFEPDWSKAPKYSVLAAINISWLTENGSWSLGHRLATYERPEIVVTPHHHAALMAKYAEVANRRVDPWVEFEGRCIGDNWSKCCESLRFYDDGEYRHIGDDK